MTLQAQRSALSPASWDRQRLKFHLAAFFGGGTPSKENEAFWTEGTIPWVSPKDMKTRHISDAEDRITPEAVLRSATNMVPPGAVLMVVRSGILKHSLPVAINTVPVALNQDLKAFRFRRSLDAGFFLFWIEGQAKSLLPEWGQIGATVDNIDIEAMLNAEIPLPDPATQRQIADFLDRETARIDLLVEKKRQFVEKLSEKRSALIGEAVTGQAGPGQGNPKHEASWSAEGVGGTRPAWLARIPAGWDLVPFGSIFSQRKERNSSLQRDFVLSVMKDRGVIPYSEKGNVGNKVSDDLTGYKFVDKGDFVLNSMNLFMGSVGVSDYDGITSTAYIVCQPSNKVFSGYFKYLIHFRGFQEFVGLLGKGIMEIREAVRWTALKSVIVPCPDRATQRLITDFLDRELTKIDPVKAKTIQSIDGLREYRSALITAAVTGQIDPVTWGRSGEGDRRLETILETMLA